MAGLRRYNTMQQQKLSPLQFLGRAAAALVITLAALFLLLLGAYLIPGGPVRQNIAKSVPLLQKEGLYPEYFNFKLFQMDNYTDTIMLFEAASADEAPPLTAMMQSNAYNVENFETLADDLQTYLAARAAGEEIPQSLTPFSYARYWHGYLIWLRPLLAVMGYGGVRVVQYVVLLALFGLVCWGLASRCNWRTVWWFAISQLAVSVWFVPHQVQFFTCFMLAYAGCVWVLAKPRSAQALAIALLVLGACTAFCDLLVTPILTLALPVTVWLLCPAQRIRSGVRQCAPVISGALCWGVGYALCWGSKWVAASVLTGQDVIGDAIHQAGVRTAADTWHGMELSWGNILHFVYGTLAEKHLFWPLVLLALLAVAALCLCLRPRVAAVRALPLGLAALMAPVWLIILRTHSIQHGWFTWRALGATLFAGAAFVYCACSLKAGRQRLARLLGGNKRGK